MAETITLDPSAVATGRTDLDITNWIDYEGVDWGDAAIEQYMAEAARGQIPVDFRVPNRTITIPLILRDRGATAFEEIRSAIQGKASLFQQEGGWIRRQTAIGPVYADVVGATLKLGGSTLQAIRNLDPDAVLTLEALPDWYGDEIALGDHPETTNSELIFTETGIKGDHPGRVRIVVDEDQGQSRLGLIWGIRSRHYDAAPTARLVYEAEALTPLDSAVIATLAGASGGASNNVVQHTSLATNWTPVLSVEHAVEGHLTHTGTYHAWVRVHSPSGSAVQCQLVWGVGDLTRPQENILRAIPGASNFYYVDLGEIRLDPAPMGPHRWHGQIQARGTIGGEDISIDRLRIVPVVEGYGLLRASEGLVYPLGPRSAGTAVDDAGAGTISWSNPSNVTADDDVYATTSSILNQGVGSHYLKATNFGFALPSTAVVRGIKVEWGVRGVGISPDIVPILGDNSVKIVKGGTIQAAERAQAAPWPAAATYRSYGGESDLWGTTWTVANINASTFGAVLSVVNITTPAQMISATPGIDHVRITVYYEFGDSDAVICASQSAELRTDGMFREDSTGAVFGPVSHVIGDLPRIPPSTSEGRPVEFFVAPSRGDFDQLPDTAIDDVSGRVFYRPSWLIVPGALP